MSGGEAGGGPGWDPGQYLKFGDQRLRPALDLLAQVPLSAPGRVYDLGCGTGEVTRRLAARWPAAQVVGIDRSRAMLDRAAAEPGRVRWIEADLRDWRPEAPADLLFSNATLHWLDDHPSLFPRLVGQLAPGGCLAVQMPLSQDLPSHRLIRETLAEGGPGGRPLGDPELRARAGRWPILDPAAYHDLLADRVRSLDIWTSEYLQVLTGADPVLEWVKGTGLRPLLSALAEPERGQFLAAYAERLRRAYPRRPDGRTLYPFRRLFLVALG